MGMTLLAMSVCAYTSSLHWHHSNVQQDALIHSMGQALSCVSDALCCPAQITTQPLIGCFHRAQRSRSPECYEQYHLRLHGGSYRKLMTVRCHFLTHLKRTLFIEALTSIELDCSNRLFTQKQKNVVIYNSVIFVSPRRTELTVWLKMAGEEQL